MICSKSIELRALMERTKKPIMKMSSMNFARHPAGKLALRGVVEQLEVVQLGKQAWPQRARDMDKMTKI